MSDHVDGPRSIGDPAADLTDLFAFVSPRDPSRVVLIANVFPSAGANALFSNAIDYEIALRHVSVSGLGDAAMFKAGADETRFRFRFDTLGAVSSAGKRVQSGTCTLPNGTGLAIVVNNGNGTPAPDGTVRAYAGLRSDPFNLAWNLLRMQRLPNLLQHDNVLSLVVEFDVRRMLDFSKGTLFGAIAETKPIPQPAGLISVVAQRIDTIGRPEQTNMRLNNPTLTGSQDLRDLWNQQDLFAIDPELVPVFRKRMIESLKNWDMRDGKANWTSDGLAASAEVFLQDHLLFDVSKPFSDSSFLEIEKSTLNGRAYETGGGRTVNANVIDILVNWMVNRDQGPALHGGSATATKPGVPDFPYLASPNDALQTLEDHVDIAAAPDRVWNVVGDFSLTWHPLVADAAIIGTGIGRIRTLETIDGKEIHERLDFESCGQRRYGYSMISGVPAAHYRGVIGVRSKGSGSRVEWQVEYLADGQPDLVVRTIVSTLLLGLRACKRASTQHHDWMHLLTSVFTLTDGEIAANNHASARTRCWAKFRRAPERTGIAEEIVAHEYIALQFFGDSAALGRLDRLAEQVNCGAVPAARAALIQARVESMGHRFRDAETSIERAERFGAAPDDVRALRLSVHQATGNGIGHVLMARRQIAAETRKLEDLVPLAAVLADLSQCEEADRIYRHALNNYCGVSPIAVAWVCFSLGVLWGERRSPCLPAVAARWYERAIALLPGYVRARVHLAEIFAADGRCADAERMLLPAVAVGDAEAHWCLAKVLLAMQRPGEADLHTRKAKRGFDRLLETHELAIADHAAAFYYEVGNDLGRALELARRNVANRPTRKALEQAHAIAVDARESRIASDLLTMLISAKRELAAAVGHD